MDKVILIRPDREPEPKPELHKDPVPFEFRTAVYFTVLAILGVGFWVGIGILIGVHLL